MDLQKFEPILVDIMEGLEGEVNSWLAPYMDAIATRERSTLPERESLFSRIFKGR